VNLLGVLEGDAKLFARVRSGDKIRLELIAAGKKTGHPPAAKK